MEIRERTARRCGDVGCQYKGLRLLVIQAGWSRKVISQRVQELLLRGGHGLAVFSRFLWKRFQLNKS